VITKTINPIHFEDLEPHRFEDLVRQLLYDFKNWKSLEATGRSGSDEGIDIRGIELSASLSEQEEDDDDEENDDTIKDVLPTEKLWVIQCKREKSIGPTKIKSIISKSLSSLDSPPFGFMLVAACDFSKKTRDEFRKQMLELGVQEFYVWGKADIEDLLFMPKNDHLLFAYFGISIQIRRRSIKSKVRSRLAIKKKLVKVFGSFHNSTYRPPILIRDPKNTQYPYINNSSEFVKNPPWGYWHLECHKPPDHLAFIVNKFFAYANWENKEWDFVKNCDTAIPNHPTLYGLSRDAFNPEDKHEICRVYSERNIPEENRAWAMTIRFIHYDRILAIDELGDAFNEGPHLLVDYVDGKVPFEPNWSTQIIKSAARFSNLSIRPKKKLRKTFFPQKIPDERKIYYKELDEKSNKDKA